MAKVSVIIPTFNRLSFVRESIESVVGQSYQDIEVIVVDDGSTDGTRETLPEQFGAEIIYFWQENKGESAARNFGISVAQGKYLAFLDSDDIWHRNKLAQQVPVLESDPSVGLLFGPAWAINEFGELIEGPLLNSGVTDEDLNLESFLANNPVYPSTALMRKETVIELGGFDESLHYSEDFEFMLRMLQHTSFRYLSTPLTYIRLHKRNQTREDRFRKIDQLLADRLGIVDLVETRWPGEVTEVTLNKARAAHYLNAALVDYAMGRDRSGCKRLEEAIRRDPTLRSDLGLIADRLADNILDTVDLEETELEDAVSRVSAAFDNWVPGLELDAKLRRKVRGKVFAGLMFVSHARNQKSSTRRYCVRAILSDPRWVRNRGLWSVGAEAYFGTKITSNLRRFVKAGLSSHG